MGEVVNASEERWVKKARRAAELIRRGRLAILSKDNARQAEFRSAKTLKERSEKLMRWTFIFSADGEESCTPERWNRERECNADKSDVDTPQSYRMVPISASRKSE